MIFVTPMTSFLDDSAALRDRLTKAYRAASDLDQRILQLFSVAYHPISRSNFLTYFSHTGIRDKSGKVFPPATLRSRIEKLLDAELLVQGQGQGPQCHSLIIEIATRDAVADETFETFVNAVHAVAPVRESWKGGPLSFRTKEEFIREVRICIYRDDLFSISKLFDDYFKHGYHDRITTDEVYHTICNNPFDPEWFSSLSNELQAISLFSILRDAAIACIPANAAFDYLAKHSEDELSPTLRGLLVEQLLLKGQLPAARHQLEQFSRTTPDTAAPFWGWLSFLEGNYTSAIAQFTIGLKALKKTTRKRQVFFDSFAGLFFILALLKDNSPTSLKDAEDYANIIVKQMDHPLRTPYLRLHSLIKLQQGDVSQRDFITGHIFTHSPENSLETLVSSLCCYWADSDQAKKLMIEPLELLYAEAEAAEYDWLKLEAAELLSRLKNDRNYPKVATSLRQTIGSLPLIDIVHQQEAWELCLNALVNLQSEAPMSKAETASRLAWSVTYTPRGCFVQPKEQKRSANGTWGKGRPIALKRLKNNPSEFDYLTPQDRRVCDYIESYYAYGYKPEFRMGDDAIVGLVGHPFVFWEDSGASVEIAKAEPELLVKQVSQDKLVLEFSPKLPEGENLLILKETPTRLKVLEVTPDHRRIADILGRHNQLEVPDSAREKVLSAISAVSTIVTVHSDIGGGVANIEAVPADSKPHVHLLPVGQSLRVAVLTRPFAIGGPYYRPGTGGATVIAEIDGKRLQTTRDLAAEKQQSETAIAACPTLETCEGEDEEWLVESPEDCLELLTELRSLEDAVILEWPEGGKLRVTPPIGMNNFQMSIQRQNDWFETNGSLRLDDEHILSMQQLMELLSQSSSRFIPLGDGQFLALTEAFRKRLDELRAYTEKHGSGLRFHKSAAIALEDLVDEVGDLEADQHWRDQIKRIRAMQALEPVMPSTLQADLRDYQREGFQWLSQLAHWGMGACLADDMGLGKTLQSLALILSRAPEGPTLILAPTSVCMNWISEAERFAPTLNIIQFSSGNRQTQIEKLQPLDLFVCSYGLLQQDDVAELLAQVQWQTIVLDEAQAIKNNTTKRSQAAMKLQGAFKMITTGTPIENHLGELWTLFRFINPGLLGSLERFNDHFAFPIERLQDKQTRNQLRKLIQPFILRRTKSQVLQELPSRTEIALHVELSQDERVMYEALRRDAIAKIENMDAPAGTRHLQVLAEITRLRRLCCNPSLVMPDMAPTSSKLQLFGEVLTELLENRHKTLVFSQFVDHLQILKNYLEEHDIAYQYLDGTTPAKERKKRVDAFQAGVGDVFLISLKAGGTGLNLTAADYVIHMDPWWNPAVEDQASDRAHRYGQQRPVTIYRLITKDTIEQKIVDLHQHKRDLADSLLEGADVSGKISTDELLQLIQFC
jgi:superfamily II DNA or RNA helicase